MRGLTTFATYLGRLKIYAMIMRKKYAINLNARIHKVMHLHKIVKVHQIFRTATDLIATADPLLEIS